MKDLSTVQILIWQCDDDTGAMSIVCQNGFGIVPMEALVGSVCCLILFTVKASKAWLFSIEPLLLDLRCG